MKYLCLVYGVESAIENVDDMHCLEFDRSARESIEARDMKEATELAARIPPAAVGSIEVRPIRPIRESPRRGGKAGG